MKVTNNYKIIGEETPTARPYPDEGEPGEYNHLPQANQPLGARGPEVSKIKNIFEPKNIKIIVKGQGDFAPTTATPPTQHNRVRLEIEKLETKLAKISQTNKTLKNPRTTTPPGPTQHWQQDRDQRDPPRDHQVNGGGIERTNVSTNPHKKRKINYKNLPIQENPKLAGQHDRDSPMAKGPRGGK